MSNPIEAQTSPQRIGWKHYGVIGAFLGLLGAVDLLLMAFYVLGIYFYASNIPSMEQLVLPILFSSTLTIISAVMLAYGSYLVWKTKLLRGGMINLLAGTLAPIPTYIYFTFFSQPTLLGWLGPLGCFLLAPAAISGIASILLAKSLE